MAGAEKKSAVNLSGHFFKSGVLSVYTFYNGDIQFTRLMSRYK